MVCRRANPPATCQHEVHSLRSFKHLPDFVKPCTDMQPMHKQCQHIDITSFVMGQGFGARLQQFRNTTCATLPQNHRQHDLSCPAAGRYGIQSVRDAPQNFANSTIDTSSRLCPFKMGRSLNNRWNGTGQRLQWERGTR